MAHQGGPSDGVTTNSKLKTLNDNWRGSLPTLRPGLSLTNRSPTPLSGSTQPNLNDAFFSPTSPDHTIASPAKIRTVRASRAEIFPRTTTANGPHAPIPFDAAVSSQLDWEVELAVVIGIGGKNIAREAALRHVFGYMVLNDVSARDIQYRHQQFFMGKSLDGSCPMGPWIVTADEVDPANMEVRCWVNGELRQDANTRDLIFDIPAIIETISTSMTLQPGDIIATGTPAGVGIGFSPPRFLRTGDVVRIEISGVGEICNTVR
jgi:2-keto-4-pentenoate hydratase/2-oxohepta-3-ene-1,7-dioic acid hydratase in catechol pathway